MTTTLVKQGLSGNRAAAAVVATMLYQSGGRRSHEADPPHNGYRRSVPATAERAPQGTNERGRLTQRSGPDASGVDQAIRSRSRSVSFADERKSTMVTSVARRPFDTSNIVSTERDEGQPSVPSRNHTPPVVVDDATQRLFAGGGLTSSPASPSLATFRSHKGHRAGDSVSSHQHGGNPQGKNHLLFVSPEGEAAVDDDADDDDDENDEKNVDGSPNALLLEHSPPLPIAAVHIAGPMSYAPISAAPRRSHPSSSGRSGERPPPAPAAWDAMGRSQFEARPIATPTSAPPPRQLSAPSAVALVPPQQRNSTAEDVDAMLERIRGLQLAMVRVAGEAGGLLRNVVMINR